MKKYYNFLNQKDLKFKIKKHYNKNQYSKLIKIIDNLKDHTKLPPELLLIYANSLFLNPKSKINDFRKSTALFEKLFYLDNSNLPVLYTLIKVGIRAKEFNLLKKILIEENKKYKDNPRIIEGLSKVEFFLGNLLEAGKYYCELTKIVPEIKDFWLKYLANNHYHGSLSQKEYLDCCKKFDELPKIKSNIPNKISIKKKKIKIGFFSPDFRTHSVSFFLKNILKKFDHDTFEIFAFSNLKNHLYDNFTTEFKKIFTEWIDVSDISDEMFINLSKKHKIDIMFDLAGFTKGNRVNVFRARCAPIQISWLGYCNSLGIKNMDYLIADPFLIHSNEEQNYTEKVVRLPKIWCSFGSFNDPPDIDFQSFEHRKFTYGSLNNFQKISNQTIELWSQIINSTNSNLILKSSINENENLKNNLLEKFKKFNVNQNKIKIFDRTVSQKKHLHYFNKFNISLDTFPYPGVTTSFESVFMGRPVLTMMGDNFNSRCGVSINKNLGLSNLISRNKDDYLKKAINFHDNPDQLMKISKNLRLRALASPLFDVNSLYDELSLVLKKIYNDNLIIS